MLSFTFPLHYFLFVYLFVFQYLSCAMILASLRFKIYNSFSLNRLYDEQFIHIKIVSLFDFGFC